MAIESTGLDPAVPSYPTANNHSPAQTAPLEVLEGGAPADAQFAADEPTVLGKRPRDWYVDTGAATTVDLVSGVITALDPRPALDLDNVVGASKKAVEVASLQVRLAAVGKISGHLTASTLTFGQVAVGTLSNRGGFARRRGCYEDAV